MPGTSRPAGSGGCARPCGTGTATGPSRSPGPGPERVALEVALAALPANQRLAVVLHYLAGLPVAEIAELCRAREGAVRTWLYRARLALARHLTDDDEVTGDE